MVVLIRCNGIQADPRVEKYLRYYQENNINYKVIGWDRLGNNLSTNNTIYFQRKSEYDLGSYKATVDRLLWFLFVISQLLILRKQVRVIHGCDLDAAFPAVCFKIFTRTKVKLIFDVFDWFSDTLWAQPYLVRQVIKILEKLSIKYSDEVIICEPERIKQIPYKLKKEVLVLPNIPSFSNVDFLIEEDRFSFDNNKITFSYVGGFYNERFLNELLQIAEMGLINLLIAGYGNKNTENKCSLLSNLPNIKYYGKVDYTESLNIMYNSDIIYAMYCKINKNHYFAAPNKYYEAMLLSKPIISTKGTSLEEKIINNGIGYVIDESIEELESLVKLLNFDDMKKKGLIANELWNHLYKNMTNDFFKQTYSALISASINSSGSTVRGIL